jgi:succinyl-CoA synthetase beta subunit
MYIGGREMKIHEYQAKTILVQYGVPTPNGEVAVTPKEVFSVVNGLGGKAVIKAQVHAGGRGKAGGVKLVSSPQEAESFAEGLLGKQLVTSQTGPEGVPVQKLLVEETIGVDKELYLAIVVDGSSKRHVIIASQSGGMDIEEVAVATPEKILRVIIDPNVGYQAYQGRRIAYALDLDQSQVRSAVDLIGNLYKAFVERDCSLVEINPLVVTIEGNLLAVDAKINIDDDAMFRQQSMEEMRDSSQEDQLEAEATVFDISYVKLDGDVGCLVNGAGLAMATMDIILAAGAKPANFLDVGGSATVEKCTKAVEIILADSNVSRILVNIFGGILSCDTAAQGVVDACKNKGVNPKLVARLLGSNATEGRKILEESGLNVSFVDTLNEVAEMLTK